MEQRGVTAKKGPRVTDPPYCGLDRFADRSIDRSIAKSYLTHKADPSLPRSSNSCIFLYQTGHDFDRLDAVVVVVGYTENDFRGFFPGQVTSRG